MYKKLIENSLDILYDKLQESATSSLWASVKYLMMLAVYKMFRQIYEASPECQRHVPHRLGAVGSSADAAMSVAEGDLSAA